MSSRAAFHGSSFLTVNLHICDTALMTIRYKIMGRAKTLVQRPISVNEQEVLIVFPDSITKSDRYRLQLSSHCGQEQIRLTLR